MSAFLHSPTGNRYLISSEEELKIEDVLNYLSNTTTISLHPDDVYLVLNGRLVQDEPFNISNNDVLRVHYRFPGGKGGFGSMLRAIGAQIEKTTSREACRDLSGRRMRDVNDEKKITEWVAKQAEREREQARLKQERLEKRRAMPKHNFDDQTYTKEIQKNLERIDDALKQGLKASTSTSTTSGLKRKGCLTDDMQTKRKMWMDAELEDSDEEKGEASGIDNQLTSTPSTSTSIKPGITTASSSGSEFDHNEESPSLNNTEEVATNELTAEKPSTSLVEGDLSSKLPTSNHDEKNQSSEEKKPFCIDDYNTAEEMEAIGLDQLKEQLITLGLKCGGTLQERAQRLFATKGKAMQDLDPSFFAKSSKGKKQRKK